MKHPQLAALLFAATLAIAPGLAVASSSQADALVQLREALRVASAPHR